MPNQPQYEGSMDPADRAHIATTLSSAVSALVSLQKNDGHWCGELQGDSILASEYLLMKFILQQEREPMHNGSDPRVTLARIAGTGSDRHHQGSGNVRRPAADPNAFQNRVAPKSGGGSLWSYAHVVVSSGNQYDLVRPLRAAKTSAAHAPRAALSPPTLRRSNRRPIRRPLPPRPLTVPT